MPTNAIKIAISLPREDFKLVEAIRRKMGITRSALIDRAIHYWLTKRRQEEMIKRYEEGYMQVPENIDEVIAMEKVQFEALREEGW